MTGVLAELPVFVVAGVLPVPVELTAVLVEGLLLVLVEVLPAVVADLPELLWLEVFAGDVAWADAGVFEEPALVEAACLSAVVVCFPFTTVTLMGPFGELLDELLLLDLLEAGVLLFWFVAGVWPLVLLLP
jgi:hypothetical protein